MIIKFCFMYDLLLFGHELLQNNSSFGTCSLYMVKLSRIKEIKSERSWCDEQGIWSQAKLQFLGSYLMAWPLIRAVR